MSIVIVYEIAAGGTLDGVTDVSAAPGTRYLPDSAVPGRYTARLPDGTAIGRVNLAEAVRQIGIQVGNPVGRAAALQRGQGILIDDFFVPQATIEYGVPPAMSPGMNLLGQADGDDLISYSVVVSNTPSTFINTCKSSALEPSLVLTNQGIQFVDVGAPAAGLRRITLFLVPVDDPREYVLACQAGGGGAGPPGPPGPAGPPGPVSAVQDEPVTTQNTGGVDVALADGLNLAPLDAASVILSLNGVRQRQGAGNDYFLSGGTLQTINWLAGTGTAVPMLLADSIDVTYFT